MKLHLGCGNNLKEGYVNIDAYIDNPRVEKIDIFNLPYPDNTVEEIVTEHLIEHIKFRDEEKFWRECFRVLKTDGILICETPDMEWLCQRFVEAQDNFKEFYKVGHKDHYFGNGKSVEHRWGIITTHFFGNQNGEGQFHYNGYTKQKLIKIGELIGFKSCTVDKIFNKGAQALVGTYLK